VQQGRGGDVVVVVVEVVATDQSVVTPTHGELVAADQSTLTRHAPETLDVVDALARSHHQLCFVKAKPAAVTFDAEQSATTNAAQINAYTSNKENYKSVETPKT